MTIDTLVPTLIVSPALIIMTMIPKIISPAQAKEIHMRACVPKTSGHAIHSRPSIKTCACVSSKKRSSAMHSNQMVIPAKTAALLISQLLVPLTTASASAMQSSALCKITTSAHTAEILIPLLIQMLTLLSPLQTLKKRSMYLRSLLYFAIRKPTLILTVLELEVEIPLLDQVLE